MNGARDSALSQAVRLREEGRADQARERLLDLTERYPEDAEIAYQAAWAHDVLGLEAEAVPFYERALSGTGLSRDDRHGAFLGLGSTYRVLGHYDRSSATFRRGLEEYPGDAALSAFLAMTLYNLDEPRDALREVLKALAATSGDPRVQSYRRAIEYYADNLDEIV
ncbi:tetratricopeptide repeat protein [Actinoallomurus purpureus]|uniref:tetratricopeptide repeat protein n=1 Tax=Actinoallomurus purpureus TaxID=478114 RepID=UPI002093FC18|nr:tetratricopeptide repeat protein [Actinoallomurus purpureus]MCO6005544.1 tetratricopeptide repeat protein [Actinoallomurus purpureus]